MVIQDINWNERISKSPKRYIIVKSDSGEMIEIHDNLTNEVWFRVSKDGWMKL